MSFWEFIGYVISASAIFWSFYVFVAKQVLNHFLNKKLEKFKHNLELETEKFRSQLRADAYQREIRFSRLHEVRMKVIAEIYSRLLRAEQAVRTFITPMPPSSGEHKMLPEKGKVAYQAITEFWDFFNENKIYLREDVCIKIARLENEFFEACSFFEFSLVSYLKDDSSNEEKMEKLTNVLNKVRNSSREVIPSIKKDIEQEFRSLLGVEKEN